MAKSRKKTSSNARNTAGASNTTGSAGAATSSNGERHFAELGPLANGNQPWTPADDNNYYKSPYYEQHEKTVMPFDTSRQPANMNLASVLTDEQIAQIKASQQISFHMNGDTGGSTAKKYANEEDIVAMMIRDFSGSNPPAFFFHLGDVVYNFGEENYYYDQFYDAFRAYNAPIFAIPGNHDGMVYSADMESLQAFRENFCTTSPQPAPNAGGLIRTTMDQPGVYFTLDAPFVSIIGLYSNVIDGGPGVISTQGGKFEAVTDVQLTFLQSELTRIKGLRSKDPRAVIVAVHHPPFSGDAKHGGSPLMSRDLDNCFTKAGLWPDAVVSGHAHHYERFQRTVSGKNIPYIIAGSGGYNNTPMKNPPSKFPYPIPQNAELNMEGYLADYGYLYVTVNSARKTLSFSFNSTNKALGNNGVGADTVTVNWG